MNPMKSFFGPSREVLWRQLADEVGGNYVKGTFTRNDRLFVGHRGWTIVLDEEFSAATKSSYVRLRAAQFNPGRFRFSIYRRGLLSGIATMLGMQDVIVGHEAFDRDFIVQGNEDGKLRALLADERLREIIAAEPHGQLCVQPADKHLFGDAPPPEVDEVCWIHPVVARDTDHLNRLIGVVGAALDRLLQIGATVAEAPRATVCPYCDHPLVAQPVCPECGRPVTGQRTR